MMSTCGCSRSSRRDADRPNVELARIVGLSPAATLKRVRRLKDEGVIQGIRARLDTNALGFPLQVYVMCTLGQHDERANRRFEAAIKKIAERRARRLGDR